MQKDRFAHILVARPDRSRPLSEEDQPIKYLPYVPLAVAVLILGILATVGAESPEQQQLLTGWAAILIGLSMALSGAKAVLRGRVLVRSRHAVREEQPVTFWATVVLFRFGVAVLFFAAGLWQLL